MNAAIVAYTDPNTGLYTVIDFDIITGEDHDISATATSHPISEGANVSDHVRPNPIALNLKARVSDSPINQVTAGTSPSPLLGSFQQRILTAVVPQQLSGFQIQGGNPVLTIPNGVPLVGGLSAPTLGGKRPYTEVVVKPGERGDRTIQVAGTFLVFDSPVKRVRRIFEVLQSLCLFGIPTEITTDLRTYPRMLIKRVSAPRDGTNGIEFSIQLEELRTSKTAKTTLRARAAKPKEKRAEAKKAEGKKGTPLSIKGKKSVEAVLGDALLKAKES